MGIAKLYSRVLCGMDALEVVVEVHVAPGLPSFSIVGLADTEIKESRDRVRSAIQNSGFEFPARRITVNLAPADLPKDSSRFDLAIACGILIGAGLITPKLNLQEYEFAGELALDGVMRPIKGALAMSYSIKNKARKFILPEANAKEAALIPQIEAYGAESLIQVLSFIQAEASLNKASSPERSDISYAGLDFKDVKGQLTTKKALIIAAAGRHSLLMVGAPGSGKSMLASRISSILPNLTPSEALATASIYSLSNAGFDLNNWAKVPFRSPHHTASHVAIVGGGSNPQPGEISLAHNGVLFLDELAEFDRKVLEVMREPLENKKINISRAKNQVEFLADFQLIAAMNPCPCGDLGNPQKNCKCSLEQINRYKAKISGPLIDRIDIVVEVPSLTNDELQRLDYGESSTTIKERVIKARQIQFERQNKLNYSLSNQEVEEYCSLDHANREFLSQIINKLGLSARSYYRLLKVARTIADLEEQKQINKNHLALASQFKSSL